MGHPARLPCVLALALALVPVLARALVLVLTPVVFDLSLKILIWGVGKFLAGMLAA